MKILKRVWAALLTALLLVLMLPASAAHAATVRWAGHEWTVRTWGGAPGKSGLWSGSNVSVDAQGRLHLRMTRDSSGRLVQAEVESVQRGWGYGTYRWRVESSVSGFDPEHVLGLFTWGSDAAYAHREIDIEAAGWGRTPVNWDYSTQARGPAVKSVPVRSGASTHEFRWEPGKVTWRSWDSSGALFGEATTTTGVPVPGDEQVMMNFWACSACTDLSAVPAPREVVLSDFTFTQLGSKPAPIQSSSGWWKGQPIGPKPTVGRPR